MVVTLFTLLVTETDEVAAVWHGPPGQMQLKPVGFIKHR